MRKEKTNIKHEQASVFKKAVCWIMGHKYIDKEYRIRPVRMNGTNEKRYMVAKTVQCARCGRIVHDWARGTYTKDQIKATLGITIK